MEILINNQLLEASGAISGTDAKSSQASNYQDIAMDLFLSDDYDDAASKDDEVEDPATPPEVNMSAIGRVCKCFY